MKRLFVTLTLALSISTSGWCADVLFVHAKGEQAPLGLEVACEHLGLTLEKQEAVDVVPFHAVVFSPSLSALSVMETQSGLKEKPQLSLCSSAAISPLASIKDSIQQLPEEGTFTIHLPRYETIAFPYKASKIEGFSLATGSEVSTPSLSVTFGDAPFALLAKTQLNGREVSVMSHIEFPPLKEGERQLYKSKRFLEIAPWLVWLREVFGERCWSFPWRSANLTIDDPWLLEPYGELNYAELLAEMEKVDFHTTIAFVPWNYDRNHQDVVDLFRENTSRYSLSVHGNNHDHQEFYKYVSEADDPWPAKSLEEQDGNIVQALARMTAMEERTGLGFDRVFVFPQSIGPGKTLGLLKKHNFLMTTNFVNVPLGHDVPEEIAFRLRPATLRFGNFASLYRFPLGEGIADSSIAKELFLGNPIIFYTHHTFFHDGADSFNGTADLVNRLEPEVTWGSLGLFAESLYMERLREDGAYDIEMQSRRIVVQNSSNAERIYHVLKPDNFDVEISSVTLNGGLVHYQRDIATESRPGGLWVTMTLPAMRSAVLEIFYDDDTDFSVVDLSKNDKRINRLRALSDFRDITMSSFALGRWFIHNYYSSGAYRFGIGRFALQIGLPFLLVLIVCVVWLRRMRKRWRARRDEVEHEAAKRPSAGD